MSFLISGKPRVTHCPVHFCHMLLLLQVELYEAFVWEVGRLGLHLHQVSALRFQSRRLHVRSDTTKRTVHIRRASGSSAESRTASAAWAWRGTSAPLLKDSSSLVVKVCHVAAFQKTKLLLAAKLLRVCWAAAWTWT